MKFIVDIFRVMNEKMDVVDYILRVMEEKDLIPADIVRRGNLSPSQVSKVLSRESPPGEKALGGFAIALGVSVESLYRRAGKLPSKPFADETVSEITHIYHNLNDTNKEDLLDYARLRLSKQEKDKKKNGKRDRIG